MFTYINYTKAVDMIPNKWKQRRGFIGGSDARIIMGNDETALIHLWQEKCGEVEPYDLSGNLIVQLGVATESALRSVGSGEGRRFRDDKSEEGGETQRHAQGALLLPQS